MPKAQADRIYAHLIDGVCHWIFSRDNLPEWSEDFAVVDVTGMDVSVGDVFNGHGFTPQPTPSAVDIVTSIKSMRDRVKSGGVLVGGNWFGTDPESAEYYLSISKLAGLRGVDRDAVIIPAWRTLKIGSDGNKITVPMSAELADTVFAEGSNLWISADSVAQRHIAGVKASDSPSTYDWLSGWPEVFPFNN